MAPRRGAQHQNSLSPAEAITTSPSSPASYLSGGTARSASPSNGFTQLFTKPTKWFNRSNSGGVGRASVSSSEPRSSTSSTRKHKISHPTDPRPIVDSLLPPDRGGLAGASRCVQHVFVLTIRLEKYSVVHACPCRSLQTSLRVQDIISAT